MTQSNATDSNFTGSEVLDEQGQSIGRVRDVVYEGSTSTPTWMVVKPGRLRAEHYVPVRGSYRTVSDKVVIPFDRHQVKSAPKANGDHVLTNEERAILAQHYHLADA